MGRSSLAVSWCEVHGKLLYTSRTRARKAARTMHQDEHKSPYRCIIEGSWNGLWHVGGLPPQITSGEKTRSEYYANYRGQAS